MLKVGPAEIAVPAFLFATVPAHGACLVRGGNDRSPQNSDDSEAKTMKAETIQRDLIDPDPNQPRAEMDGDELKQLALSMRSLGQLQPIVVYRHDDRFKLIDGHRRHAALALINCDQASALVLDAAPDADTLLMTQYAANCMRVDLTPAEKAQALKRLKEAKGWNNAELAKAMHISKSMVTQLMSVLTLPEQAKEMLNTGDLPLSTAYAISRAPTPDAQNALLDKASRGELKRDEAQQVVQSASKQRKTRITFELDGGDVTIVSSTGLDLTGYVAIGQQLVRECRKAGAQGLDAKTLARVLVDRRAHLMKAN